MKNLDKYLTLLSGEVDGLLLTSPYSRYYAAEYEISAAPLRVAATPGKSYGIARASRG